MSLNIRPAGPHDVEVVIDILAESSAWLKTKGITQWPERFPRDLVMLNAERGELYVAVSGDEITATATLQWSDATFWGEREDAGFLHRLAVRRHDAGIGPTMIEWAQQQVVEHGRTYLCLDCLSSNARLRRYYEDLGFNRVGEINAPIDHPYSIAHGAWQATLYEKMVGGTQTKEPGDLWSGGRSASVTAAVEYHSLPDSEAGYDRSIAHDGTAAQLLCASAPLDDGRMAERYGRE